MSFLERLAEQKIRAALERGELDNLPLSGKPLPLEPRGLVPEDLSLAYKLLKDAGFLPPEMELRKQIATLMDLLQTVTEGDDDERYRLARELNAKVLRLNLLMKRSFDREDRQVYARKLTSKMLDSKVSDSKNET